MLPGRFSSELVHQQVKLCDFDRQHHLGLLEEGGSQRLPDLPTLEREAVPHILRNLAFEVIVPLSAGEVPGQPATGGLRTGQSVVLRCLSVHRRAPERVQGSRRDVAMARQNARFQCNTATAAG